MSEQIFLKLRFYIIGDIGDEIKKLIIEKGGKIDYYLCEMVNYVLAEDDQADEYSEAVDLFQLPVITTNWIKKSIKCGVLLPSERFSPDSKQIFYGVNVCPYKISGVDVKSIWAVVTGNGGRCQGKLNSSVTHLVTTTCEGVKPDFVKRKKMSVKLVTPDWFETCMKEKRKVDEKPFNPAYLCEALDIPIDPTSVVFDVKDEIDMEWALKTPVASVASTPDHKKRSVPKYVHNMLQDADITAKPEPPQPPQPPQPLKRPSTSLQYKEPKPKTRRIAKQPGVKVKVRGTSNSKLNKTTKNQVLQAPYAVTKPMISPMVPVVPPPRHQQHQYALQQQQIQQQQQHQHIQQQNPHQVPKMKLSLATTPPTPPTLAPVVPIRPQHRMPYQARPPQLSTKKPTPHPSPLQPPPPPRHVAPRQAPMTTVVTPLNSSPFSTPTRKQDDTSDPFLLKYCMAGCVFLITDYEFVDKQTIATWKQVIKNNGGLCSESYTNSVTHLICESVTTNLAKAALKSGKRLVTAHWLNDCLKMKRMKRPWLLTHLPNALPSNKRPCTNQIFTLSNFEGIERQRVQYLITSTGAKYTNYLTKAHSLLISKKPIGYKYRAAQQWGIAVASVEFLAHLLLGQQPTEKILALPLQEKFTADLNRDVSILHSHRCQHLLDAWNVNVGVTEEYQNAINAMMLDQIDHPKSPIVENQNLSFENNKNSKYQIMITGISNINKYNKIVYDLGGVSLKVAAATPESKVTHLVATRVLFTEKFLCSFSRTKYVLTTAWLNASAEQGHFIDESRFILKDEKAEARYNFNMLESILLSSKRGVFEGMTFYLSPCLQSCRTRLADMINSGQGKVTRKQPSGTLLTTHPKTTLIIAGDVDKYLFRKDKLREVVYNTDLILHSILQQRIDLPKHKMQF